MLASQWLLLLTLVQRLQHPEAYQGLVFLLETPSQDHTEDHYIDQEDYDLGQSKSG